MSFDPLQAMSQAPSPQQQGMVPTQASPGGDPGPNADPLHESFVIASNFLGAFANQAKQVDAELANQLDQMKNKLVHIQLKRQNLIRAASEKVGNQIGMQ